MKRLIISAAILLASNCTPGSCSSSLSQQYYDEAVKLQQLGRYSSSLDMYKKAINAEPNEASYHYSMGTCLQASQQFDAAIASYKQASALNPSEPAYELAIKQAKKSQARPLFDSAISNMTDKKLQAAAADLRAAISIDSEDPALHHNFASVLELLGNQHEADAEYGKARDMAPDLYSVPARIRTDVPI